MAFLLIAGPIVKRHKARIGTSNRVVGRGGVKENKNGLSLLVQEEEQQNPDGNGCDGERCAVLFLDGDACGSAGRLEGGPYLL